jgi:hypothetical protein
MNHHLSWKRVERDGVDDGSDLFLNHPNLPFNLRDVLISTCQVKLRRSIHHCHPSFKRSKFAVTLYEDNLKTSLKVITAHTFQCIKDGESLPIAQVRHRQKEYDHTVGGEEWYLVDKKMSIVKVTSLCSYRISFGISMTSCLTTGGIILTVFPFNITMLGPHTVITVPMSLTVTGQSLIKFDWIAHFISALDGNTKAAWRLRTRFAL